MCMVDDKDHQLQVVQELAQQLQQLVRTNTTSAKLATTVSKLIDRIEENEKSVRQG